MSAPLHIDAAILNALRPYGAAGRATYVVRNILRETDIRLTTQQVRARLLRLERDGKVERAPSNYVAMNVWRVKDGQP